MNKRKCKDCGKEINLFKNQRYCKNCSSVSSTSKRMIRNREFIKDYKKDKQCETCGYRRYPKILEFHHKDKETKNQTINTLMKTLQNLDKIKEEVEKCMLLCPNCHRELHLKEEYGK